jgi:hypothetical protein
MSSRRFTRLTNAFSKKLENHAAAVSLHVAHYNLCRIHEALTPSAKNQLRRQWPLGLRLIPGRSVSCWTRPLRLPRLIRPRPRQSAASGTG